MTTGFFSTPGVQAGTNGLFRPANSSTSFGLSQGQSPFGTFGIGQSFAESGASNNGAFGSTTGGFTPFLTPSQFATSFGGQQQATQNNLAPQVGFNGFDESGDGGGDGQGGPGNTGNAVDDNLGDFMDHVGLAAGLANPAFGVANLGSYAMTGKTIGQHLGLPTMTGFLGLDGGDGSDLADGPESMGGEHGAPAGSGTGAGNGANADEFGGLDGDGEAGGGDGGCVIATHAVSSGAFTRHDKAKAVAWCRKRLHGSVMGEAFRRGYRWHGNRAIAHGRAERHYDEFRRFVSFVTGKERTLRGAWIVAKRGVQFTLTGLFVRG